MKTLMLVLISSMFYVGAAHAKTELPRFAEAKYALAQGTKLDFFSLIPKRDESDKAPIVRYASAKVEIFKTHVTKQADGSFIDVTTSVCINNKFDVPVFDFHDGKFATLGFSVECDTKMMNRDAKVRAYLLGGLTATTLFSDEADREFKLFGTNMYVTDKETLEPIGPEVPYSYVLSSDLEARSFVQVLRPNVFVSCSDSGSTPDPENPGDSLKRTKSDCTVSHEEYVWASVEFKDDAQ